MQVIRPGTSQAKLTRYHNCQGCPEETTVSSNTVATMARGRPVRFADVHVPVGAWFHRRS